ncbi:MAG: hypothetical protein DRG78_13020 [Epsilonproteobacteria bacterium]|nr:MAG: hypothetical protein DRG78_13020 [Campylobacterota bacterium]
MEIKAQLQIITITGNIKSIGDFAKIKSLVDEVSSKYENITINIIDSLSITSSVIGYFNKLILKDKIGIKMNVGSKQLLSLLDDLNLTSTFKAKRS